LSHCPELSVNFLFAPAIPAIVTFPLTNLTDAT
jgi:hypothetical protein